MSSQEVVSPQFVTIEMFNDFSIKMMASIEKLSNPEHSVQVTPKRKSAPSPSGEQDEDEEVTVKPPSVIYYEENEEKNKMWKRSTVDDSFTTYLKNETKFRLVFEEKLPEYNAIMFETFIFIIYYLSFVFLGICFGITFNTCWEFKTLRI
jgi:hypothetical protein